MPILYLLEQGSTLHKEGETFVITKEGEILEKIPAIKVEQIIIFGNVNITTPAIHFILSQDIDCVFCSNYGKFHGRLISNESSFARLRQLQLEASLKQETKLKIAKAILIGKIQNQRALLLRHGREKGLSGLRETAEELLKFLQDARKDKDIESLRGIEGISSARYYSAFRKLLKKD